MSYEEPNMKYLVAGVALAGLLTTPAYAQPPPCKAQAAERDVQAVCKKSARKARAADRGGGLTPAIEESLDRAMARNVLRSIEEQLQRQRIGK